MEDFPTNPYRELGVEPGASPQKLKQAYRKSVMRYHPDTARGGGNTEKFRQVTEAYKLLQKMSAYEMTRSVKKTANRASNLRQKFSSVFHKKKQNNTKETKEWWTKNSFQKRGDEKIKVNQQTNRLSIEELINCVELSENEFVRQVAMEAIAARRDQRGINYLIQLLQKSDLSFRSHVIKALALTGLQELNKHLFPFVMDQSIEISTTAIKALERINSNNRQLIIDFLRNNKSSGKNLILKHLTEIKKRFLNITTSKNLIGNMLLRSGDITEEQLEIALLLQNRFPLLLGQILRHLEYVTIPEIQNSITSQKINKS